MKSILAMTSAFVLCACGLESAGNAAIAGKLQSEQAKQAMGSVDKVKADLDASLKAAEEKRKKLEDAGKN